MRTHFQASNSRKRILLGLFEFGDVSICCPETSVNTSVRCVTSQKNEDLSHTSAEASNQARQKFCLPHISPRDTSSLLTLLQLVPDCLPWQNIYFSTVQQPKVGQGLLIIEALRSHSDTTQSVGLLWTSDRPVAEISTWQHTTLKRDIHPCHLSNSNPQPQQLSGRGPTPSDRAATGIDT
jgi:hypothetical protein